MATFARVTYLDGTVKEVRIAPRAQTMAERKYGGLTDKNMMQTMYFMSWVALKAANEETAEFEPWLDAIEECETFVGKNTLPERIRVLLERRDFLDKPEAAQILDLAAELERDDDVDPTQSDPLFDGSSNSASPPESPISTSSG
jgi:hypothetical protein